MLPLNLSVNEARVIGCLLEKSVTTPEQCPLTLNALTNACNQKSSRDPIMSLPQGTVQHTVRDLESKHLLLVEDNFKRGVEKYSQRFCNTSFSELQFDSAQYAIVCLLLLRGPQTPGELKARSGRLHQFDDNSDVVTSLTSLIEGDSDALAVKLPRTPGRKDAEYMHLFCGPVDVEAYESNVQVKSSTEPSVRIGVTELEQRISDLETEVAKLKQLLQ